MPGETWVLSQGVQGAQYMAGARETDQAGKLAGLDSFCLVDPHAGSIFFFLSFNIVFFPLALSTLLQVVMSP